MPTIELSYNLDIDKFEIETDLKKEKVPEVLEAFLRCQLDLGEDSRRPIELPVYKITIHLDLRDDSFWVESNTGNDGLTTGIVAHYLSRLKND
jgi:hypothetical protein